MTWVLDRGGTVGDKASWTNAANLESFLQCYVEVRRNRSAGRQIAPYYTEQLELGDVAREAFLARLERNGHAAVEQWHRAQQLRSPGG